MNIKTALDWLRYFEPARLKAAYVAIVALLLTFGVSIPAGWDERVTAILAALAIIVPLIQGEITRTAVVSPATHDTNVTVALNTPAPATLEPDAGYVDEPNGRAPEEVPADSADGEPGDHEAPPKDEDVIPADDPVDQEEVVDQVITNVPPDVAGGQP